MFSGYQCTRLRYINQCIIQNLQKCLKNESRVLKSSFILHKVNCALVSVCNRKHYSSSVSNQKKTILFGSTNFPEQTKEDEVLYRAIDILIKGHEPSVLSSYMTFMSSAAEHLDITVAGQLIPKFIADRSTFLKSIHIFKKHRVQYETRTHRQVLQLKYLTGSTARVYLEYVQRNIPAGVAMHVHKWQLQQIPKHINKEMKKNMVEMTEEDWELSAEFIPKMKSERKTCEADYEEYHTTKRFLLGTVM